MRHGRAIVFSQPARPPHWGSGVYLNEFFVLTTDDPFVLEVGDGRTVLGQGFGDFTGSKIEISDNAVYGLGNVVNQPINLLFWSDDQATLLDVTLGAMALGFPRYVWLTTADGDRNTLGLQVSLVISLIPQLFRRVEQEVF